MNIRFGDALQNMPWTPILGVGEIIAINRIALQQVVADWQERHGSVSEGELAPVLRRMQALESFFTAHGSHSPLTRQFERARKKGLPPGDPVVQALLMAEISSGLLMGAQNLDALQGGLIYDLAKDGEKFTGMRGDIQCRAGELVLRDSKGTIASLLQGPDFRTRLSDDTANVVFFVFSVPGIDSTEVRQALDELHRVFLSAASEIKTYLCDTAEAAEPRPAAITVR